MFNFVLDLFGCKYASKGWQGVLYLGYFCEVLVFLCVAMDAPLLNWLLYRTSLSVILKWGEQRFWYNYRIPGQPKVDLTRQLLSASFFWVYSRIGIVGISQTIVRSRATLIPEWLWNLHSDTVNWFWHVCNQLRPEKEGLFWSFQLFLFRNRPKRTRP